MTDVKHTAGGPSVPVTTLVQCDQVTILGDGSHEHPLRVAGDVLNNGGGGGGGGGSGGGGGGGATTVTTDGTTIIGDGSPGSPLHTPGGGVAASSYRAGYRGGSVTARPGQPVFVGIIPVGDFITTVQPAAATNQSATGSAIDGVVQSVNSDGSVNVQSSGPLVLTTAQWDAVTGLTGGLVMGDRYFLAPFPSFARLLNFAAMTPLLAPGLFVSQIGVAASSTTMLLSSMPNVPDRHLGDLTFIASLSGQPVPVGSAVYVSAGNTVAPATSSINVDQALAIGVIAAYDNFTGNPIVQIGGVCTLTTAEWDAALGGSGNVGLGSGGGQFFVDTAAHPGRLTTIEPLAGAATQVGISLSATQLLLGTPSTRRIS